MLRRINFRRAVSIVLIVVMLISAVPAFALNDEDAHDKVPGYTYEQNAPDLHNYKYFKIYEKDGAILGEGKIGGTADYKNSMIPDGGKTVIFEFLTEKSQDIRLELWSVSGEYLGLIAHGRAEGQWGVLDGDQWHDHDNEEGDIVPVANQLHWDGKYWDTTQQAMIFPGQNADGTIEKREYEFLVRLQPTNENTQQFTVDVPLKIDYSDEAVLNNSQLRDLLIDPPKHL